MKDRWNVEWATGSAATFHHRPLPDPVRRTVWVHAVDRPALVLGSTQPDGVVDEAATNERGVEVVRRRSGGGAVLLEPGGAVWVDVVIPSTDCLWADDVEVAFAWLGEAWVAALADLGVVGEVHRGRPVSSPWSRLVCFAGLGPGEVTTIGAGRRGPKGAKVVGMAQRRTRDGARFQCAVPRRWEPDRLLALLALDPDARAAASLALAGAAAPVTAPGPDIAEALLGQLPGTGTLTGER